jgi:predicted AlkP superfamily pyrophosphatase or phosphodiesterase
MSDYAILLSIPGLRSKDLASMPRLSALGEAGITVPLKPSFPCVTCPVQTTFTTGVQADKHGVIANGFYWREKGEVEMWTAWNDVVEAPQIWDRLREHDASLTSAVWFPLLSKGVSSDYVCTFAPIHNPDGSESLWCYTKPTELYGDLRDELGHFPLMNFWGPMSNIKSTDWIVDSAIIAANRFRPRFFYLYLPHLDYAAQKFGPDSPQAETALEELDTTIGRLVDGFQKAGMNDVLWLAASEYVITQVDGASFPNRRLRENGFLSLQEKEGLEYLVPANSAAWAMVDHQFAHVYVQHKDQIQRVADLFRSDEDVAEVLVGDDRKKYGLNHLRSGEIVLISHPRKWFAYYWWLDDAQAPDFARTVDIHRKPGYDPVEMFIDMPSKTTPLDASLVKGSHGYPADDIAFHGTLVCSECQLVPPNSFLNDLDIFGLVLKNFGIEC